MIFRSRLRTIYAGIVLLALVCCTRPFQALAAGTGYQVCKTGADCTVGEYLYDDSYAPILSATCTLTSRNVDGTVYINNQAMTAAAQNDGWYSWTFNTTGKDEGIYRSQVCCTSGSDYLCLDKTFQISSTTAPTAAEVASTVWDTSVSSHTTAGSFGANLQSPAPSTSDIWGYSDRSLTSYGSLIADIWGYTSRSLSSFGTLVADIWTNATRTITAGTLSNGTHIATQEDVQIATGAAVASIKGASNKDLTQVGTQVSGVQTTADTINGKIDSLTTTVGTMSTNVSSILTKWSTYSAGDIITAIGTVQANLGTSADTCSNNTVFGNAYCAKDKWGAESASSLLTATTAVGTTATALRTELAYNGKSTTAYQDMQDLLANLSTLTTNVATVNSNVTSVGTQVSGVQTTANTINGKIDTLSTTVGTINTNVSSLLTKWSTYSASDILTALSTIQSSVGTSSDDCSVNTVFGNAYCAKNKWGAETAGGLLLATNNVATTAAALRVELDYNGKSSTAYQDLQLLLTNVGTVASNVTSVQSTASTINTKADTIIGTVNTINTTTSTGSAALALLETKIDTLGTKMDTLTTSTSTLLGKWGSYSAADIITGVTAIQSSIGTNSDSCVTGSLFGFARCASDKWGVYSADDLVSRATTIATTAASIRSELGYNGKSTTAYQDMQSLLSNLSTVSTNIDTVQMQVTGVDSKLDTVSARVLGIDTTVSTFSAQLSATTTKLDTLITTVGSLNTKVTDVQTGVNTLLSNWSTYTMTDVITKLTSLQNSLGTTSNTCVDLTVFGYLTCIENNGVGGGGGGGSDADILAAARAAASSSAALRAELDYNGKSATAYQDLQSLKSDLSTMNSLIGTSSDTSDLATLFGRMKKTQETIESLDTSGSGLSALLQKWGSVSASDIYDKVKDLSEKIEAVNAVSDVEEILTLSKSQSSDLIALKNKVLELTALTQVNKSLLQDGIDKPIVKLWLEEGSIIFKTLITNPSSSRQTVPLKFYLPREAKKDDILNLDPELVAKYDPEQDAVFVSGEFTLKPKESKIVAVEVDDIWKIQDVQIASIRQQAEDLFKPLLSTSYFAQGSTLKSDVTVAMDTIIRLQSDAKTPEARIKAYRDATTEMKRANEDLMALKTLGAQASAAGTLIGSLGGIQTVAAWGLIIILTTGFIFLALYMRMLLSQIKPALIAKTQETSAPVSRVQQMKKRLKLPRLPSESPEIRIVILIVIALCTILFVVLIALKTNFFSSLRHVKKQEKQIDSQPLSASPVATTRPTAIPVSRKVSPLAKYGDTVNVRKGPGKEFDIVGTLSPDKTYPVLDTLTDKSKTVWLELQLDQGKLAWVASPFVQDVADATKKSDEVVIRDQKEVLGISTETKLPILIVTQDDVKLRMEPFTDSRFKIILTKGMKVKKIGQEKDWTNVEVDPESAGTSDPIDGWVKTFYLEK